ncbi:protein of unknown function (plasmid) [Cupriavidus taiwanensis]|uniref:Uncharacterized protein n=1 Tax=Cupriavidus taiwanensis TaxID=164546 RepID=A0A7Z7JCH0_9BURK|nr:protein of unknown function [Cupriavidus taiwanensis]SOZ11869.1 protein of unknown function [Cupriavidus taiwanensis]SOZ43224.1 protein of unknown function [Cupriavidus taiwanensis]SPC22470.1 protein of unknown function [Cupriavidus taiwanensis]SPD53978.1 protein of unknown function [Cupriavidus taiwanensis]
MVADPLRRNRKQGGRVLDGYRRPVPASAGRCRRGACYTLTVRTFSVSTERTVRSYSPALY